MILPLQLLGQAAEAPVIETSTALLLLLLGAVVYLARSVALLRRDVEILRDLSPAPGVLAGPAGPAPAAASGEALPPELQVVICAAVAVALGGRPARVLEISAPATSAGWSLEGRRDVFGSHRVR